MMPFPCLLLLLACSSPLLALDLAVLLPEGAPPLVLERALRADPLCRQLELRVLAKWRSLEEILQERPRVVIAPAGFALIPGWKAVLAGRRPDGDSERLLLIAIDPAARIDDPALVIGLAQGMPRAAAEGFIATAFGLRPAMVRLAARPEDAVAMLGLDLARAVVATPAMAAEARRRFPALRELARSVPIQLPLVFVHPDADPAAGQALAGIAPATLAAMGLSALVSEPRIQNPVPAPPAENAP